MAYLMQVLMVQIQILSITLLITFPKPLPSSRSVLKTTTKLLKNGEGKKESPWTKTKTNTSIMSLELVKPYLTIEFFGRYTNDSGGKDKLLRLGCYVCRLAVGIIDKSVNDAGLKADLLGRITGIEKSMGGTRRVMRVGKIFGLLNNIMFVAPTKYKSNPILKYLDILKSLILICYNYNDHLYWIGSVGLVKGIDQQKRGWNAGFCWFLSLIVSLIFDTVRFISNWKLEQQLLKSKRSIQIPTDGTTDSQHKNQVNDIQTRLNAVYTERNELYVNFIRNIIDLPLGATGTFKLTWVPVWVLGLCGTITSAIGIYQTVDKIK